MRYSQRKNTDHTTVDVHAENVLVNKLTWNIERHPEKQLVYVCECTCVICDFCIRSKKKRNPTEQNSCPQHQLPEEILS